MSFLIHREKYTCCYSFFFFNTHHALVSSKRLHWYCCCCCCCCCCNLHWQRQRLPPRRIIFWAPFRRHDAASWGTQSTTPTLPVATVSPTPWLVPTASATVAAAAPAADEMEGSICYCCSAAPSDYSFSIRYLYFRCYYYYYCLVRS